MLRVSSIVDYGMNQKLRKVRRVERTDIRKYFSRSTLLIVILVSYGNFLLLLRAGEVAEQGWPGCNGGARMKGAINVTQTHPC